MFKMGKKLELLTILNAARTMTWENQSSSNGPTKEQLIGALGFAQRDKPIGVAILRARYDKDKHAIRTIQNYLNSLDHHFNPALITPAQKRNAIYLLIADAMEVPIDVTKKRVVSAWKRYSMKGERTKKTIESLSKALASMERAIHSKDTKAEKHEVQVQIDSLKTRIKSAQRDLDEYAERKAGESFKCPRCRSTGIIQKTYKPCSTCNGTGEFRIKDTDWRKSLVDACPEDKEPLKARWPEVLIELKRAQELLRRHESDALTVIERRIDAEYVAAREEG